MYFLSIRVYIVNGTEGHVIFKGKRIYEDALVVHSVVNTIIPSPDLMKRLLTCHKCFPNSFLSLLNHCVVFI